MFKMEMTREDVEKFLDLQVRTGNMSEQVKEEKLREYDMLMQQRNSGNPYQQYEQPNGMPYQQYGQPSGMPENGGYPRIKPHAEGYLNGPEMIGTLIIAVLIIVAAKMESAAFLGILMGILFTYIGVKIIYKDRKEGNRLQFLPVVATICGVLMLIYGFFKLLGSSEAQSSLDRAGNTLLPFIIMAIGIGLIIGYAISINSLKKRYTISVQAKCIQLVIPRSNRGSPRMRAPIYEYWYNGETRRTFNPFFSNRGNPAIDEVREIYVSHDDDGGYYEPSRTKTNFIFTILLGAFFIIMGVIVIYLTYFH